MEQNNMKAKVEYEYNRKYLIENLPPPIKNLIYGNDELRAKGEYIDLLPEQREVLMDYYLFLTNNGKITSYQTYKNLISVVSIFGRCVQKPFNEVTRQDLQQYLFTLELKGFKANTMNEKRIKLKTFFRFLYGTKEYPEVVSWIQLKKVEHESKTEEVLLSRDEIRQLLEAADNTRDRALISVLYETAARKGELCSVRIKHVIPDKYGMKLKLPESKTKVRVIRLIDSVPYVQEWLNNHPYRSNLESPLFVSWRDRGGGELAENSMQHILKRLVKRAKIAKRVYPHLFRHSRLDELGRKGFNERDLMLYAGWKDDSKMPQVYLHYDEAHLDKKILQEAGLATKEDTALDKREQEALKPRQCARCKTVNSATSKYCNSCGMALDLKDFLQDQETVKAEIDDRLKVYAEIMQNPEKRAEFEKFKKIFFQN